jgi:hypothetical protein
MLMENEVVMLVLGIGVLFLILMNLNHVRKIKSWKIIITGYCVLLSGWLFTILEGFWLEPYLNVLEHICYATSALFLVSWVWRATGKDKEEAAA